MQRLLEALGVEMARALLARWGKLPIEAGEEEVRARLGRIGAAALVEAAAGDAQVLDALFRAAGGGWFPGRAEALLLVARRLGVGLPEREYALPEESLEALVARAEALVGQAVPVRGARRHKGRVGDGVERLLVGKRVHGRTSDHPAAEIKSVPVRGEQVIERVKLGVVSPRSNPLEKCRRILFVFVEQRGDRHFVRGHGVCEFDPARFAAMWRDGLLVETAAGTPRRPSRGLYLVPRWFRQAGLWPLG